MGNICLKFVKPLLPSSSWRCTSGIQVVLPSCCTSRLCCQKYFYSQDAIVYFVKMFIILAKGSLYTATVYNRYKAEFQQKQLPKEQLCKSKDMREMSQHVAVIRYHRKILSFHSRKAPMLLKLLNRSGHIKIILFPPTGKLWAKETGNGNYLHALNQHTFFFFFCEPKVEQPLITKTFAALNTWSALQL